MLYNFSVGELIVIAVVVGLILYGYFNGKGKGGSGRGGSSGSSADGV